MKITRKKKLLLSTLSLSLIILSGCANNQNNISKENISSSSDTTEYVVDASDMLDTNTLLDTQTTSKLSEQEKIGLIQMREEEKLARDVYTTLGAKWGKQIFTNIAKSEQTHTDAIKNLLQRYEIEDPVVNDTIGIFTSATIQKLYTDLVVQGNSSLLNALTVGALIEDLDIKDLNTFIQETTNQDIISVYTNLTKGSRNHLRAYVKNINNNDGKYSPEYISQGEYNLILSSPQERGGNKNGMNR